MEGGAFPGRIDTLCGALLRSLALFEKVQRRFHPALMARHGAALQKEGGLLGQAVDEFARGAGEERDSPSGEALTGASRLLMAAITRFSEPADDLQAGVMSALRAGRKFCRACELLFSLRRELKAVDAFFRDAPRPGAPPGDAVLHLDEAGGPYARGNASLYVPGHGAGPRPLIVALHGGFGHGRDFLWSWIRQARSRGMFLLAPTSTGATWSLADPGRDLSPLLDLVDRLGREYPLDRNRVLLTGFSDGGTFCLGCAQRVEARFAAFSPMSGVLPPGDLACVRARRIFRIHGAWDWMFPVAGARAESTLLERAGADLTFLAKDDLAHALPGEEFSAVLSWFDPGRCP